MNSGRIHIVSKLRWPFHHQAAVTLWPFGIWMTMRGYGRAGVVEHEEHHWKWQKRTLGLWYVAYLALWPIYRGGRRHPLERAAYAIQDAVAAKAVRLLPTGEISWGSKAGA